MVHAASNLVGRGPSAAYGAGQLSLGGNAPAWPATAGPSRRIRAGPGPKGATRRAGPETPGRDLGGVDGVASEGHGRGPRRGPGDVPDPGPVSGAGANRDAATAKADNNMIIRRATTGLTEGRRCPGLGCVSSFDVKSTPLSRTPKECSKPRTWPNAWLVKPRLVNCRGLTDISRAASPPNRTPWAAPEPVPNVEGVRSGNRLRRR